MTPTSSFRVDRSTLLSLLVVLAILLGRASAALPYTDGDLFIGFRATGGEGGTTDYLVNIGSATQFTAATGQIVVNTGNLLTDLANTFSPDWKTRSDVYWSISGVQAIAGNGFPNRTMFATAMEPTAGTQSTPWTRPSVFAAGAPVGKMQNMALASGYAAGNTENQMISPNNPKGLIQATLAANSYASNQPGGSNTLGSSAFVYFNPSSGRGIEGTFENGTVGSVLDFYKLEPGSGPAVLSGAFRLDNNGVLTFSPDISVFAPPANVSFPQTSYSVNEDAAGGQVVIQIVRAGNAGTAFSVNLSTSNDSAIAGTDYTAQVNVPVAFAVNDTTKTVNIPITRRLGYQGNRSFGVSLSSPTGSVSLGAVSTATVAIVEVDPAPASVGFSTVSFPVTEDAGSVVVTLKRSGDPTAAFTVNFSTSDGTAVSGTDFTGQTNVAVTFAAGELTKAVSVAVAHRDGFQGDRSFTVTLSSPSGAILAPPISATVPISEIDLQPATLAFSAATFIVAENVAGGSLAITINRTGMTTAPGSVTLATTDGTALAGTDYTAQNAVVISFAAGETTKTANVPILDRADFQGSRQFTVTLLNGTNGGVLGTPTIATVTITDKGSAVTGTYRGLISPVGAPLNETSGIVGLTVTTSGNFTGRLMLGGGSLAFSGRFDSAGVAKFKPGLTSTLKLKLNCATPLDLGTLALHITNDVIDGDVNHPGAVANVHLERDVFNGRTPATSVDPALLANGGRYTVILPSKTQAGLAASAFPQGDGIGFLQLDKTGKVTLVAVLADGQTFTTASILSKNYTCPIFVELYKMLGSFAGNLSFQNVAESDLTGTGFLWIRPAISRAVEYAAGWPAGIRVDGKGARYAIPPASPATSVFPGLGATNTTTGNATLELSGGKLTATISKNLNIFPSNVVRAVTNNDPGFRAVISPETGRISGSFTHSDGRQPSFTAVIYQKGTSRGAFGFFLNKALTTGTTSESGRVKITPK